MTPGSSNAILDYMNEGYRGLQDSNLQLMHEHQRAWLGKPKRNPGSHAIMSNFHTYFALSHN